MEHGAIHTSFIVTTEDTTRCVESDSARIAAALEAQALIEEARRRARRRRRRAAAAGTVVVVAIVAFAAGVARRDDAAPPAARPAPTALAPERVLAREPYAGVSCRVPNSIACDRMGLAVWTRRPVRAVRATVAGRAFTLDDPNWGGPARGGLKRMFAGYLVHAGLRDRLGVRTEGGDHWTGVHPVELRVRLLITAADGTEQTTVVPVLLSPGWG